MGYRKDYIERGKEIDVMLLSNKEKIESKEITCRALCKMCNCSITMINNHLAKLGIDARQFEYSQEQEDFIRENYPTLGSRATAEEFNKKFGTNKSYKAIRSRAKVLGVTTSYIRKTWTPEQEQWLKDNYATGYTETRFAEEFNKTFNTNFSSDAIKQHAVRYLGLRRQEGYALNKYRIGEVFSCSNGLNREPVYFVKIDNISGNKRANYVRIPKDVYENNALIPNSALAYGIAKKVLKSVTKDIGKQEPQKVIKSRLAITKKIREYVLEHQDEIVSRKIKLVDIAEELGVSYNAVLHSKNNLSLPAVVHSTEGLDEYLVNHKEEIFAKKITDEQIATRFNLSVYTVINHRQKLGIKLRKRNTK